MAAGVDPKSLHRNLPETNEKRVIHEDTPKDGEGPPSVTALPHRHGLRPGKPAPAPLRSESAGRTPTRERGRPARMHSRCVPLSFPAMRHPATLPAGTAGARPKQSPGAVAGRPGWRRWPRLCQDLCGRDARVPGGLHFLTSSQQSRFIGLRVYSWFVFNKDRQFRSPMIRTVVGGGGAAHQYPCQRPSQ